MPQARIFTNDFNRIITATKSFVGSNDSKKANQFIKLEFSAENSKVTAMAVDGYRLSVEHSVVSHCNDDFTVYVKPNVILPKNNYATIRLEEDGTATTRCEGLIFGYDQPEPSDFDWQKVIPQREPSFKIGFNGNYLLSALQAAKASCGNSFKKPVVLEFRGPMEPVILKTNREDIKLVLPIRISSGE